MIDSARPGTGTEHVGSTAVPGLPGKGIIDLGIEASPDEIPQVTDALLGLGFQRQGGMTPFPATRPMLVGALVEGGDEFRIHLHVMPPARHELPELVGFRDALRADASFRAAYAEAKLRIVGASTGIEPQELYTAHKADFVKDALYRLGIRRPPADAPEPLAPGAVIGIMGGGQLGRMLGQAARSMAYRVVVLDPDPHCPAAAVADEVIVGTYDDVDAALRLAERADVVTYELEHVGEAAAAAARLACAAPPGTRGAARDAGSACRAAVHPRCRRGECSVARGAWGRRCAGRGGGARVSGSPQDPDRRLRRAQPGPDHRAGTRLRRRSRPWAAPTGDRC